MTPNPIKKKFMTPGVIVLILLAANAIGFVAVYAIQNKTTTFLDVGLIIALLAFLGTVAFAYYLERRTRK